MPQGKTPSRFGNASLSERIGKGDAAALKELLEQTAGDLFRFLFRFLGEKETAETLLTAVYLSFLKEDLSKAGDLEKIRRVLWKTAHKLATKEAFSMKKAGGPAAPRAGTAGNLPVPDFVRNSPSEDVRSLRDTWSGLDVPYREALALAGIEPLLPYEDAAEILDGTRGTLRSRLAYALRLFLKEM